MPVPLENISKSLLAHFTRGLNLRLVPQPVVGFHVMTLGRPVAADDAQKLVAVFGEPLFNQSSRELKRSFGRNWLFSQFTWRKKGKCRFVNALFFHIALKNHA